MVQDKARGGKKRGRHCTVRVFTDTLASSLANVRGMPTLVSAVFPFMSPYGETMAMLQKLIFIPVKLLVTSSSFAVINYQITVAFQELPLTSYCTSCPHILQACIIDTL